MTCWSEIYRQYFVSYSQSEGETQGIVFHIHSEKYSSYSGPLVTTKLPVGDYFLWTIRNANQPTSDHSIIMGADIKNAQTVHISVPLAKIPEPRWVGEPD